MEDRIILSDGTTIGTPAGSVTRQFVDPEETLPVLNPLTGKPIGKTVTHGEIYAILWSLFIESATKKDVDDANNADSLNTYEQHDPLQMAQ